MKAYSVIVAAAMLFLVMACRKERSCTCVTTDSGVKTVRTQSPPVIFTLTLPPPLTLPVTVPPFTITPAVDQSTSSPYNVESTEVITYDRIKYGSAKQICTSTSEEKVNTSESSVSGTSTITTSDVGTQKTVCKLD
jgi:hypothetical protein